MLRGGDVSKKLFELRLVTGQCYMVLLVNKIAEKSTP